MQDLTLVIPAKHESESLPIFLKEINQLPCKKIIVLDENDFKTVDAIKKFDDIEILYQKKIGYGSALIEGINSVNTTFFCIINADGSMNPSYLFSMWYSCRAFLFVAMISMIFIKGKFGR